MSYNLELWHKRLGHMNTRNLVNLVHASIVCGIPKLEGRSDDVCKAYNQGKQVRVHHKKVVEILSKNILDLLHMDLMALSKWRL